MKRALAFFILLSMLIQSCADSNFLDRSRKDQSILQGVKVTPDSNLAKSIVLITQDLVFEKNQPFFFGICTGLIVSKRAVLTAGHCLDNGHKTMKIILNPNPRDGLKDEEIYSVLKTKMHRSYELKSLIHQNHLNAESFQDTLGYNDIALLLVDRDFPTDKSSPYTIFPQIQNQNPELGTVTGFGRTTAMKDTENFDYKNVNGSLRQAHVNIKMDSFINGRILLGQQNEAGVCKGDSGAPLFVFENGIQKPLAIAIGVFSKVSSLDPDLDINLLETGCASYGVYLVLEPLQEWITRSELELRKYAELLQNTT